VAKRNPGFTPALCHWHWNTDDARHAHDCELDRNHKGTHACGKVTGGVICGAHL
jgi:hypothetical protein